MSIKQEALLKERDRLVARSIGRIAKKQRWPPSLKEIADDTGISLSAVSIIVGRLELAGWVRRKRGVNRSLELVRELEPEVVTA